MGERKLLWLGCGSLAAEFASLPERQAYTQALGVRRRPERIAAGFEALAADFNQPGSLAPILAGGRCSHIVVSLTPGERSDAGYQRGYVAASATIIAELQAAGVAPERVVFVSSTSVYGQSDGEWVDESSVAEPDGFAGQRLLEAEALWRQSGLPVVCVRFSGIYGPGRNRLLQQVLQGQGGVKAPPVYTNRIHQHDCARVIAHLLASHEVPELLIGTDSCPAPQWEVKSWLAEALGQRLAKLPPLLASAGPSASKRLSNKRLLAMGIELQYPSYREGYPAIIDAFIAGGAGSGE